MSEVTRVLLLGAAGAGKTTLLAQLYGRLQQGSGLLRIHKAPDSIAPIAASLRRLEQGLMVEHTPNTTNVEQVLPAVTHQGDRLDVVLPDYAGETLASVVDSRHVTPAWPDRIRSAGRLVVLLRLSQHFTPPDVLDRPVQEVRPATTPRPAGSGTLELSMDLWTVELLQIVQHILHSAGGEALSLPPLTIALSCWDELGLLQNATPASVLAEKVPLVADFCAAHWGESMLVVGLSAQGQTLVGDQEDPGFIDRGPQQMGWLVLPDGNRSDDLTRLLTDP